MRVLKSGEHIGIIALSAACEENRFKQGLSHIEQLGFTHKIALEPYRAYGSSTYLFSSDTPEARAQALMQLYRDKEVGLILAARGAYGCAELLPLLDFKEMAKNPKPLVGFSDTTALLVALYGKGITQLIHGPSLESSFSKAKDTSDAAQSARQLIEFVTGKHSNPFSGQTYAVLGGSAAREARGPLIGGNLTVLTSLVGTPWDVAYDDHVLFLEEVGEKPYRVHRMLSQLKNSGKFKRLKGLLLGSFRNCEHEEQRGPSLEHVLLDIFKDAKFPILSGLPFGHVDLNLPMPLGVNVHISNGQLEFST